MRYFYDGPADDADDDRHHADGAPHQRRRADAPGGNGDAGDDEADAAYDAALDAPLVDDGSLDETFPRGDGTADTEAVVYCPYCGELNEIAVDPGGGSIQSYIEDCHVCCRPWRVAVRFDAEGHASASLEPADE